MFEAISYTTSEILSDIKIQLLTSMTQIDNQSPTQVDATLQYNSISLTSKNGSNKITNKFVLNINY
ncbi:hypothetical protein IKS57_01995 [bacterium]|nr:hypothetical protein [bacterium]